MALFPSKAHRLRMEKLEASTEKANSAENQVPWIVRRSVDLTNWLRTREEENHIAEGFRALFETPRGEGQ